MNRFEVAIRPEGVNESFYIHPAITSSQIEQLIAFTQSETDPVKLGRDGQRFMSREQYEEWSKKGRTIYTLTDNIDAEGRLKGIFWAGEKELPDRADYSESLDPNFYRHTYAFRLYDSARGKGISHSVLSTCIDEYVSKLSLPVGFWLETSGANEVAIHMDEKQGFRVVSGKNDQGLVTLVREYAMPLKI